MSDFDEYYEQAHPDLRELLDTDPEFRSGREKLFSAPVWPRKLSLEQRKILKRYTIVEKPGSVTYHYRTHEGILSEGEPWMDIDKLEMYVWGDLFNSNILPEYVGYGWLIGKYIRHAETLAALLTLDPAILESCRATSASIPNSYTMKASRASDC